MKIPHKCSKKCTVLSHTCDKCGELVFAILFSLLLPVLCSKCLAKREDLNK